MDLLFFLRRRMKFLREHYKQSAATFIETKRNITDEEPPLDNPPYGESGEPAFLEEYQDAEKSLEFLGQSCVSFLSAALKLFLNESEQQFREYFGGLAIPDLDKAEFKKEGFVRGYHSWFASMGINMEESGVDIGLMEEIVLTRNLAEHPKSVGLMHLSQTDHAAKKFPHPFFANPIEEAYFERQKQENQEAGEDYPGIPWMLSIQPEKFLQAIDEVEKLCTWLEPEWLKGPKKLPKPPEPPEPFVVEA